MNYRNFIYSRMLNHAISVPFIWSVLVPLLILDVFIEMYHRICFPLYNLPLVKRDRYIKIDRHKLEYLGWMDKMNCAYCGYANGLLHYATKIAAETEKYWCGIKHVSEDGFIEPAHHKNFVEYGNREAFESRYKKEGSEEECKLKSE